MEVIVLGAGAAGLSAARTLLSGSSSSSSSSSIAKITIFEARDRVGGRTLSVSAPGGGGIQSQSHIEHGGEFVHGGNTSTAQLAAEMGMHLIPVNRYGELNWNTLGAHYTTSQDVMQAKQLHDTVGDKAEGTYLPSMSLRDAMLLETEKNSNSSIISFNESTANVLLAQTWCSDIDKLSVCDVQQERRADVAGPDEYRLSAGGYSELWRRLVETFDNTVFSIRYQSIATEVDYNEGGEGKITIRLASGESLTCDYLISSIPVAVLPSVAFSPPLPAAKQEAIRNMRTAAATKAILIFRLDGGVTGAASIPELVALQSLASLWTDDAEAHLPRWWTPWYGAKLTEAAAETVAFCGFATDSYALRFDALTEEAARQVAIGDAAKVLSIDVDILSNSVVSFQRVSWAADPFARGGYATVELQTATTTTREDLYAPINGRVFFAGEACCFWGNKQTVHGAVDTGREAALRLIEEMQK
jgi:monoamine oxidase